MNPQPYKPGALYSSYTPKRTLSPPVSHLCFEDVRGNDPILSFGLDKGCLKGFRLGL